MHKYITKNSHDLLVLCYLVFSMMMPTQILSHMYQILLKHHPKLCEVAQDSANLIIISIFLKIYKATLN
jgi:hypothetical protein